MIEQEIFDIPGVVAVVSEGLDRDSVELGGKGWIAACKDAMQFALNYGTVRMILGDFMIVASCPSGTGCAYMIDKRAPGKKAVSLMCKIVYDNA